MTEALILGKHPEWKPYLEGWILNAGIVTKVFIEDRSREGKLYGRFSHEATEGFHPN
jgi:hypothetical protein